MISHLEAPLLLLTSNQTSSVYEPFPVTLSPHAVVLDVSLSLYVPGGEAISYCSTFKARARFEMAVSQSMLVA